LSQKFEMKDLGKLHFGGKESRWTSPMHQPNQIPQGNIETFSNVGM
jgi:hypothetical protein